MEQGIQIFPWREVWAWVSRLVGLAVWNTVLNQDNPLNKHQIHYITSQQNTKLEKLFCSVVSIVRKCLVEVQVWESINWLKALILWLLMVWFRQILVINGCIMSWFVIVMLNVYIRDGITYQSNISPTFIQKQHCSFVVHLACNKSWS